MDYFDELDCDECCDDADDLDRRDRLLISLALTGAAIMLLVAEILFPRPIIEQAEVILPLIGLVVVVNIVSWLLRRRLPQTDAETDSGRANVRWLIEIVCLVIVITACGWIVAGNLRPSNGNRLSFVAMAIAVVCWLIGRKLTRPAPLTKTDESSRIPGKTG